MPWQCKDTLGMMRILQGLKYSVEQAFVYPRNGLNATPPNCKQSLIYMLTGRERLYVLFSSPDDI